MTVTRLLQIVAAAVVVLVLLSAIDFGRRYLLQQDLAEAQAAAAEQTRITEQIERSLAGRATNPALLSEIETRETNLAQLESTLEILRTVSMGNLNGFSEHLKNLSTASMEGLWLTEIRLSEGGTQAALAGFATRSALVPNFVERLSAGWVKSPGWRFSRLSGDVVLPDESGLQAGIDTLYQFQLEAN